MNSLIGTTWRILHNNQQNMIKVLGFKVDIDINTTTNNLMVLTNNIDNKEQKEYKVDNIQWVSCIDTHYNDYRGV